jgi:glycosyltransferase involved in cell wall biosynthesis
MESPLRKIVFDIRANHDTGVSRYGRTLLAAAAEPAADAGLQFLAVVRPGQRLGVLRSLGERARELVKIVECPHEEGFVRRSRWLRNLLENVGPSMYFTSHYTLDRECPIPFVFTIHDLIRLKTPQFSYSDPELIDLYGDAELGIMYSELEELRRSGYAKSHHNGTLARYLSTLYDCLLQRACVVVTVSEATTDDLCGAFPAYTHKFRLIAPAVDTEIFYRRGDAAVARIRRKFGLGGPYLLYVGLSHPHKRLPWLVSRIAEKFGSFSEEMRLAVVGGYGEMNREVKATMARTEAARRLVVFVGRVDDDDLACLYSGASALVSSSTSEGFGLSQVEAHACGCPVIATDIPANREALAGSGYLYPQDDSDLLCRLASDALRGRLRLKERKTPMHGWNDSGRLLVATLNHALRRRDDALEPPLS